MASYSYGPPPPPPPSASGGPSYGQPSGSYAQHGQGRGGGASNGRRGGHFHGGRGDYHGVQPHYEYTGQPYPAHTSVPYGGTHPPAGSFPPHQPQWTAEQGHAAPLPAHAHAPAPLSSANYHPNFAPQPYAPLQYQYGPPPPYGHSIPGTMPPNQPQWNGHGAHQAPFGNNRGRGGYSDRSGPNPPRGGAPGRYDTAPPPLNNGFGQPYPPPQYPYAGPPAPSAPPRQGSHRGQHPRRGRGGHKEANARGRGGHQNHHHGGDRSRHPKPQNNKDGNQNPEPPSVGKKKKRKTNTLGLTPGGESDNASHTEDGDEEKDLAEMMGKEMPKVGDHSKYLAERRKAYPTRARIMAIKAEQEAHRAVCKAARLAREEDDLARSLEKQADRLRRQLRKVEVSIKRKRDQRDEGDEMRDSSEESSDDEPEIMSTRSQITPRPPRKPDSETQCKYFSTGGICGKKGKCRFLHDMEARVKAFRAREANGGRLTIQQRLMLNDKDQEDLSIISSIQYLRTKGVMHTDGELTGATVTERDFNDKNPKSALLPRFGLLPAASPSLPPLPVKREPPQRTNPPPSIIPSADSINAQGLKHYEGWLLKPYGSASGQQSQSDDLP